MSARPSASAVRVHVASILHEYTSGESVLEACGKTVAAVLADLDRRHPGLLFRIVDEQDALRPHIKLFIDGKMVRDLGRAVPAGAEMHVLQALSGG